jgi:hypothetical protein
MINNELPARLPGFTRKFEYDRVVLSRKKHLEVVFQLQFVQQQASVAKLVLIDFRTSMCSGFLDEMKSL